jgi:hypothetical protein
LVIETEFGPFKLPSSAFDQLLLLVVFKFCDDRSGTLGLVGHRSKSLYSVESHLVYSLYRKFYRKFSVVSIENSLITPSGLLDASSEISGKRLFPRMLRLCMCSSDSFITLFSLSRRTMLELCIFTLAVSSFLLLFMFMYAAATFYYLSCCQWWKKYPIVIPE